MMRWNIYLFFHIAACIVICGCQGEDAYSKISFPTRTTSLNFDDAVRYCEKTGASLPSLSLTNTSIYERMVQGARSTNIKSFWLGLRKWQNGRFLYLNNRYPTTELRSIHGNCGIFDIFNPIPVRAIECRLLYPGYICRSSYDQADCRNMKSFIQLPIGCFFISRDPGNWFSARYACQRKGLQLAYFDSNQEEADILNFFKKNKTLSDTNQFYWIGVRRMDYMFIHALSNTTESVFSNLAYWENGQPKSDGKHSCVLATNTNKGYNWTAESCFSSHPVICEAAISIQTFTLGTSTEQFITQTSDNLQLHSMIATIILSTAITMVVLAFVVYIVKVKYQRKDSRRRNIRAESVDNACIIELTSEAELTSEEKHPLITQQGEQSEGLPYYNILLVGVINAGKSTLINSSIMAINGKERCKEYALRGARRKENCTLAMRSHKVVCRSKTHIDKGDEKGVKFSIRNCVPVFWELPGLENKDSAQIKRIMKNLYRGGLYDGPDIEQIQSRKFCFRKHQKIHLIVFVHPITEKLPDKVMDGVNQGVKTMRKGQDLFRSSKKDLLLVVSTDRKLLRQTTEQIEQLIKNASRKEKVLRVEIREKHVSSTRDDKLEEFKEACMVVLVAGPTERGSRLLADPESRYGPLYQAAIRWRASVFFVYALLGKAYTREGTTAHQNKFLRNDSVVKQLNDENRFISIQGGLDMMSTKHKELLLDWIKSCLTRKPVRGRLFQRMWETFKITAVLTSSLACIYYFYSLFVRPFETLMATSLFSLAWGEDHAMRLLVNSSALQDCYLYPSTLLPAYEHFSMPFL